MEKSAVVQGREIGPVEIDAIRWLIVGNPHMSRYKLSRELCELWGWRNPKGELQDMAARSLLLKLHDRGAICLPAKRRASPNRKGERSVAAVDHANAPIESPLHGIAPLRIYETGEHPGKLKLFEHLLHRHHYLSYKKPVGLNLKYLIADREDRPLGCLLFGSAAWKCRARDEFVGWSPAQREKNLQRITNNTRFLILPWVKVECLASHVLGTVLRRLRRDWHGKYARPLDLVETFVDTSRFRGVCYRAANWKDVGKTTGRTRQDRDRTLRTPEKAVLVYPLNAAFRRGLLE
jgi:hypothetical protein